MIEVKENMLVKNYKQFWSKALKIEGKTKREAYWQPILINILIYVILFLVVRVFSYFHLGLLTSFIVLVESVFSVITIVPGLSSSVRRLRDVGKEWTYLLWGLLPVVGAVLLILALSQESVQPKKRRKKKRSTQKTLID